MKRICILLCAVILLLSGCGKTSYKSDVNVEELGAAVEQHLKSSAMASVPESYLAGAMDMDPAAFSQFVVKINAAGLNIDEFGIFRAPDEKSVKAVEQEVKDYLQLRKDIWMDSYMPEEKPKLEKAKTRTCGLYVMYAIAADSERDAMLDSFEKALKN